MMWPKYGVFFCLAVTSSENFVFIILHISFSHGIRCILLEKHMSKVFIIFRILFDIVHLSTPNNDVDQM